MSEKNNKKNNNQKSSPTFGKLISSMPLTALMESLGEGVIVTDKTGHIQYVNPCAENLFAIVEADARNKLFNEVISTYNKWGDDIEPKHQLVYKVLHSGRKVSESSHQYSTAHRKRFPAAATATPIIIDGEMVGTACIFRDIRKETEIDKAKTEFVSLASHQLRTPLTAIKLFTEILLNKYANQPDGEESKILGNIELSNEKMIGLVNNLLNAASIEAGRIKIELSQVAVLNIVNSIAAEFEPLLQARQITMKQSCNDKGGMRIETDANLLRQVIHNIVSNSVQYSSDKGKIDIKIFKEQKFCIISIQDEGIGISKKAQKEIFNRFFRDQNAIRVKTESTGLGLYVGKMMMQALGGKIRFQSEEGEGTTFFICIPLKPPTVKNDKVEQTYTSIMTA